MFAIIKVVERKGVSYTDVDIGWKALVMEIVEYRPYVRKDGKVFYHSLGGALDEIGLPKNKGEDLNIAIVESVGDDYYLL